MSLHLLSIGQLAACVAYLLLAYAFFLVSERNSSLDAKAAAIAFAYCGIGIFAQIAAVASHLMSSSPTPYSLTDSYAFHLLFNAPRPWALLLAGICVLRIAKSISPRQSTPAP